MTTFVRRARSVAFATLAALAVPAILAVTAAPAAAAGSCAPVTAHRGVTYDHVENTRGSIQAAIDLGIRFEVDLRATSDGRIVLMHDPTIDRTTDGSGRVADLTAREIRSYSTDDGGRVPLALAALRMIRGNPGATAVLDLKTLPASVQVGLADAITRLGIGSRVRAISFRDGVLATFRELNPGVDARRTYGSGLPAPVPTGPGVEVRASALTADWGTSMRAASSPFGVWNADDAAAWQLANDAGADNVITNDPAGYATWCANRQG